MAVELHREASEPSSGEAGENARKFETLIFQRISLVKQTHIAQATGLSEATMHRIVAGDRGVLIKELYAFLDILNLAVIERDGEGVTLSSAEYEALRTLARKGLDDDRRHRRPT